MNLNIFKDVIGRMVALFLTSAAGTITGAAALAPELSMAKAAAIAGVSACVMVLQKLAAASLDGNLSREDVDSAFEIRPESRNNDQS
jgi:hypothetical protein